MKSIMCVSASLTFLCYFYVVLLLWSLRSDKLRTWRYPLNCWIHVFRFLDLFEKSAELHLGQLHGLCSFEKNRLLWMSLASSSNGVNTSSTTLISMVAKSWTSLPALFPSFWIYTALFYCNLHRFAKSITLASP